MSNRKEYFLFVYAIKNIKLLWVNIETCKYTYYSMKENFSFFFDAHQDIWSNFQISPISSTISENISLLFSLRIIMTVGNAIFYIK